MDLEKYQLCKQNLVDGFFNYLAFDENLSKERYVKCMNDFIKSTTNRKSLFRYRQFIKAYDFIDLLYDLVSFSPVSNFNDPFDCDYLFQVTSKNINDNDKIKLEQTVR